jgi:thymidylate kinase
MTPADQPITPRQRDRLLDAAPEPGTPVPPPDADRDGKPGAGLVIGIVGPDGTGKTAIGDMLEFTLGPRRVLRLHHRPRWLPTRTVYGGPVTDPHKDAPYGRMASLAKVFYLFADFCIGWVRLVRPAVRAGGTVVLERGWWDILVDPNRYRLSSGGWLVRALGHLLPSPHITFVLAASPEVLLARKKELPEVELQRQMVAWRDVPAGRLRGVHLDVSAPMDEVHRQIMESVEAHKPSRPRRRPLRR